MPACAPALAEDWSWGDANFSLQTTLSSSVGIRTSPPDGYFLDPKQGGSYGGTSGPSNKDWQSGNVFQAPLAATHDLQVDWSNYTLFARGTYFFDPILSDPNNTSYAPIPHTTQQTVGHAAHLLDGFVRGKYHLFGQTQSVTAGYQTFNWGESTFIRNGLNAVNPINVAGIHLAGADLKSLYLPVPALDVKTTLGNGWSAEAFNEFVWAKSQLDPSGSFFSLDTQVGPGINQITLPPKITALGLGGYLPRENDRRAADGGEFGVALRKTIDDWDGAQLGFYFENYGSRFPVFSVVTGQANRPAGETYAASTRYFAEYPNHIQDLGVSLSGAGPWGSALQGEVSFQPNQPLQLNALELVAADIAPGLLPTLDRFCKLGIKLACQKAQQLIDVPLIQRDGIPSYGQTIQGYDRFQVTHVRVSDVFAFGSIDHTPVQDWSLTVEYGLDAINDFVSPNKEPLFNQLSVYALNQADANFFTNGIVNRSGQPSQISEGIVGRAGFSMPALLFNRIDVSPSLAIEYDFQGTTPAPLATFTGHVITATAGVNFSYLQRWNASISYTGHYALGNALTYAPTLDRDYVAASISYRF